jgi:sulfur carrier protein
MTITLNGDARETASTSIDALARELTPAPETLLIEHNGTALHRSDWAAVSLKEGDRLEILRVSAGG